MIDWSHTTKAERDVLRCALVHYLADMRHEKGIYKRPKSPPLEVWREFLVDDLLDSLRGR